MPESLSPDLSKIGDLFRFEVFIPITDNDGELIDSDKFDDVTHELTGTFGGVSIDYPYGGAGGIDGIWLSSVTKLLYHDRIAVFMVLSRAVPAAVKSFKKMQKKWEREFDQEKILVLLNRIQSL